MTTAEQSYPTIVSEKESDNDPVDSMDNSESENKLSQKRPADDEGTKLNKGGMRKRKKVKASFAPKTALMKLNEAVPGLTYEVECVGGPPHQPIFKATVVVEKQTYEGTGKSKQLAKLAAADSALRSFIQFPDMFEAQHMFNNTRNILNDSANANFSEDMELGQVNKSNGTKPFHVSSSLKSPVMLLNEMHPGLQFNVVSESGNPHEKCFTICVEFEGESYVGTGPSKKLARAAAASELLSKKHKINVSVSDGFRGATDYLASEEYSDLVTQVPQEFADTIGRIVYLAFDDLMKGLLNYAKYKVLSGIVLTNDNTQEMKVICLTTGTKCINGEHISVHGAVLNDCHAEILTRRCLIDFLYTQLESYHDDPEKSVFMESSASRLCIRPEIKFHLYISTAPCGDSRIFSPKESSSTDKHPLRKCRGQLRTKIESGEGTIPVVNSENTLQTWDSILAGKRLLTMSCSDKVARWMVVGLQGAILSNLVDPIYLNSVILGSLYHPGHMLRALSSRFSQNLKDLPALYELREPAMQKLSVIKARHPKKAPNHSVNWTTGHLAPEIVNTTTGKVDTQTPSRLCKRKFFERLTNLKEKFPQLKEISSVYSEAKAAASDYQLAKSRFSAAFADSGLGHWMRKPLEQDQFSLAADLDSY